MYLRSARWNHESCSGSFLWTTIHYNIHYNLDEKEIWEKAWNGFLGLTVGGGMEIRVEGLGRAVSESEMEAQDGMQAGIVHEPVIIVFTDGS